MTTKELSILLLYLLRSRDYIIISDDCRKAIESATDYTNLVHIENESGTVNWKAELLPDCAPNEYRLWSAKDWQTTDNVRSKVRELAKQMLIDYDKGIEHNNRLRARIVAYMLTLNVPVEVTEKTMLAKLDLAQLMDFAKGLKLTTD